MTINELVKILDLSSGSPTAWKNGTIPRNATLVKLAAYFGVSVDFLAGTEKAPAESGERDVLDDIDIAFYGEYRELTEDDKETVRDMVRVMRERRAKKQEQ